MDFGDNYYNPMDRETKSNSGDEIEKAIIGISDIGMSVTEGRGMGTFRDSIQSAIRMGAKQVELSSNMEGAEKGVGVESYGKEARKELREMAKANEIKIVSTHTPAQIGNMSGYAGPDQGFNDEARKRELDEVKKAINFAAEAANGGAVVVHTGEFQRPLSEQEWNKDEDGRMLFKGYAEEPEKAIIPIVNKRTGQVLTQVRKNQIVHRPVWLKNDEGEYTDYEGKIVGIKQRVPVFNEETGRFEVEERKWDDFVEEAEERNILKEKELGRDLTKDERIKPEEAFIQAQLELNSGQSRGWALYHSSRMGDQLKNLKKLKKAKEFYDDLDKGLSEEEKWKIVREDPGSIGLGGLIPPEYKPIPEILNEQIRHIEHNIEHTHQGSVSYEQQAKDSEQMQKDAVPIEKYAKEKTISSYAESGIYAMDQSEQYETERPVFLAPENLFPEMGYGSHPEELIALVQGAREKMVKLLTSKEIEGPGGEMVENQYYRGMNKKEAQKKANDHIKATLDTAHMGLWWKYFEGKQGETEKQKFGRFENWYQKQIEKLSDSGIIGHMHVVDNMGRGDTHIPVGQGVMPVKTALEYLKEKGYDGTMISEAYSEGVTRQLAKTWEYLGSPIYGLTGSPTSMGGGGPTNFGNVHQSYFGKDRAPYFVFGAYAPSNDWTLWSQVPLD